MGEHYWAVVFMRCVSLLVWFAMAAEIGIFSDSGNSNSPSLKEMVVSLNLCSWYLSVIYRDHGECSQVATRRLILRT